MADMDTTESMSSMVLRVAGPLFFIGMQISACNTALAIQSRGSVSSIPLLPFLSLFVNCVIWTLYGILKNDFTVLVPNVLGILCGLFCVFIYHKYSSGLHKGKEYMISAGIVIFALILYASNAANFIALLGCVFAVILMGSPLATLKIVIETQNTDSMPFGTSLMAFCNSLSWSMYGLLISGDVFIYGPNLVGVAITSVQMLLFIQYGIQSHSSQSSLSLSPSSSTSLSLSSYGTGIETGNVTGSGSGIDMGGGGGINMQPMPVSMRKS